MNNLTAMALAGSVCPAGWEAFVAKGRLAVSAGGTCDATTQRARFFQFE
ncbi:MAG: hypothetical protein H0X34_16195 [Chthoniobacterales bacterium]|nr:hypothetical protein [Chthoniobacterales bacterium]